MSFRYKGAVLSTVPPNTTQYVAPGLWTLQQQFQGQGGSTWPLFSDPYYEYVSLLLTGDGTNGAQNNTFLDSSTNNFTITRNGNTTQGTFSPYGDLWSNYFDGTGDYLSVPANAAFRFGTGDFCIEFFYYPTEFANYNTSIDMGYANSGSYVIQNASDGKPYFYSNPTGIIFTAGTAYTLNAWNHLAVCRSGTNLSMYLNGVRVGNATSSGNLNANYALGIGGSPTHSSSYPVFGYMSNVRLVKGSAVYNPSQTTITVPASTLTAITNTSLLTCQSNRFIDNSSNNFAITVNGNTSVQRFSPFNPTAPYSASTIGGSGYFDGTSDYLTLPTGISNFGTGDFTVEFWAYYVADGSYVFIDSRGNSFSNSGFAIYKAGGNIYVTWQTNNHIVTARPPTNQWNHFAVCRSSGVTKLYINGVQSGATPTDTNNYTDFFTTIGYLPGVPGYDMFGYISNVRIVKGTAVYTSNFTPPTAPVTAITNTSLLCNFTNAGIPDAAMQNDLETVGNAQVSTSVKKYGTGSLYFDGIGDYLQGPVGQSTTFRTGDFTVEAWVYVTNLTAPAYGHPWFECRTINSSTAGFCSHIQTNGQFDFYTGSSAVASGGSIVQNTWTHLAITRSGTTVRGFQNGSQVFSATVSNDFTEGNLIIGTNQPINNMFYGYIDDLRITKGVARYTANFTPPGAPVPTY